MMNSTGVLPRREQAALATVALRLRSVFGPRLRDVRLFGSGARGEYGPDSDLDVLVVVADLSHDDFVRASRIASEVSSDADVLVSLLPMTPEHLDLLRRTEQRLARELDEEGIPL